MNVMSDGGGECMVQEGRKEWPGCQQTEGAPPEASAINVRYLYNSICKEPSAPVSRFLSAHLCPGLRWQLLYMTRNNHLICLITDVFIFYVSFIMIIMFYK